MAAQPLNQMDYYVYVLFRWNGLPFYVGKGRGRRITNHEWYAQSGRKTHCANVIRQMYRDGHKEVPKLKVAEGLSHAQSVEYEIAWIAAIGRESNGGLLVNLTDGGDGPLGLSPSPEHRAKNSIAHRGKKRSAQARANISAGKKGKPLTTEHIAKISVGRSRSAKPVTDETRAKLSVAGMGNTRKLGYRDLPETVERKRKASYWAGKSRPREAVERGWATRRRNKNRSSDTQLTLL